MMGWRSISVVGVVGSSRGMAVLVLLELVDGLVGRVDVGFGLLLAQVLVKEVWRELERALAADMVAVVIQRDFGRWEGRRTCAER